MEKLPNDVVGRGKQMLVGDDASDQAVPFRFVRRQAPAREQHVASQRNADVLGQDRRVIGIGDASAQLTSACRLLLAFTRSTARRIPKYMFAVSAFRRSGRSIVTQATASRRSHRRNREPRSTSLISSA